MKEIFFKPPYISVTLLLSAVLVTSQRIKAAHCCNACHKTKEKLLVFIDIVSKSLSRRDYNAIAY